MIICSRSLFCLHSRSLFLSLFRGLFSVFDMYLECLPFLVVGFLSAFVVSCVVVVNGQQHHVCRCALSLLIADGLIADGQQHHVCGVMRSRSWWATTSRLWCHALSFLHAEKIIFVVSGVVVAHCSFAPVIMATLWVVQWRMLSLCKKEEFQIMLCLCFPVAALYKIVRFLLLLMGLGYFE